ncbi:MAG: hypothetical protein ABIP75_08705 [Pyrinomonadaceae bacterium]
MKKNIPVVVFAVTLAMMAGACSKPKGKLQMQPLTHVGVGKTATLAAYDEQKPSGLFKSSDQPVTRETVTATWTVSDPAIASITPTGTLTGVKPGTVMVKGAWEGQEVSATVQVAYNLSAATLPVLTPEGAISKPKAISLALGKDRTLKFTASFDDPADDVAVSQTAPDQKLPWSFTYPKGTVELTSSAGRVVTGTLNKTGGGKVAFTLGNEGSGAFPLDLRGKTFILIGDSMAEGLAWTMRAKVEAVGGKFISEPSYSSTTILWEKERRMTEIVNRLKPDIIMITLGSNEVIVPNVEGRASAVKQINEEMGDRPSYWIGPPSWKPDKGIVHVIESNFRPGRFYNSNDLKVPRRRDGAHPTPEGMATWADLVWAWYLQVG